jgi:DNA modification methylase/predicted RNA-binding Zn-ribbon protein involved in translation (DUF1610 family)
MAPAKEGSDPAFAEEPAASDSPVSCLGKTFDSAEEQRRYFTEELREKLKDPVFRAIEGFPLGTDEDILALSDPPYYTACPNPWIQDFIAGWEAQKPQKSDDRPYHREPFAADVSEGKNDPIYNAHSYHTKVPHRAIMRYILHYTEPGDIVFDGFCGTGMTGVAAQMCGDRVTVESLGYRVEADGTILQEETDGSGKKTWTAFSRLGARRAVLNDLSPAATFIAHNYNTPVDADAFAQEAERILKEAEDECGWMYETMHTDGKTKGKINYTVWSDVFICPDCSKEIIFSEAAFDRKNYRVLEEFPCPHCGTILKKNGKTKLEHKWITRYDSILNSTIKQAEQIPVLINYTVDGKKQEKKPDVHDIALIEKIENNPIPYWFPTTKIPKGDKTGEPLRIGITHLHHFYTKRNLWILSAIYKRCSSFQSYLWFNSQLVNISKLNRYRPDVSFPYNPLSLTLYIGSQVSEASIFTAYKNKLKRIIAAFKKINSPNLVFTNSANTKNAFNADYIFIDPPFGHNIMYSELNYLWESWLKVMTNNKQEAIENKTQKKGVSEYRDLMTTCFEEAYRILKPGRWMTVEFSNTKAYIWNNIQAALSDAGFIVANVSVLDKKQGSFNAVTNPTSVKQDLIISAYKPDGGFEERFQKEAQTEEGVWAFVQSHLRYLPVIKIQNKELQAIPERDPRIIYDQMIAYYVRKGYPVPMDSPEFQGGLKEQFDERDGMYFLHEQTPEYDKKRQTLGGPQSGAYFVSDESSAIQWLRQLLKDKPQSFQDINPLFMQEIAGWSKTEKPLELKTLLEQNFLSYDGKEAVPEQIHAYLSSNWKDLRNLPKGDPALIAKAKDRWYVPDPNKAQDLEKIRDKSLLKEFEEYKQSRKKIKLFRIEAVRAGFKKAYQDHDYRTIIDVADKLPAHVLDEDQKLLLWYGNAQTRLGGA